MTVTKTTCDRCGNEIKPEQVRRVLATLYPTKFGRHSKPMDLCESCIRVLETFLPGDGKVAMLDSQYKVTLTIE